MPEQVQLKKKPKRKRKSHKKKRLTLIWETSSVEVMTTITKHEG